MPEPIILRRANPHRCIMAKKYIKKGFVQIRNTIVITMKHLTDLLDDVRMNAESYTLTDIGTIAKKFIKTHIKVGKIER